MGRLGNFAGDGSAYRLGRPSYGADAVAWCLARTGLGPKSIVADVGAGTGLFTSSVAPFVERVYAVEPIDDMRAAIDASPAIVPIQGTAEQTQLADASVDAVFVAQALHWFNVEASIQEWRRVLRGERWIVGLWNELRSDDPLAVALQSLLARHASVDLSRLGHRAEGREEVIARFDRAGARRVDAHAFPNRDTLDRARLEPFLSSISYLPKPQQPAFAGVLSEARALLGEAEVQPWQTVVRVLQLR